MTKSWSAPAHEVLRARPGFDLAALNSRRTPGWRGDKGRGGQAQEPHGRMSDFQERLFADEQHRRHPVGAARDAGHGHRG